MGTVAFIFPGQGSQYVGMGRDLAALSPAAAEAFAEADAALGEPVSRLAFEGDPATLDLTANAQPALLATSIAYLRALRERARAAGANAAGANAAGTNAAGENAAEPAFFAGHSMGQYSAMVAAGALSLADGVRLVRERGRLMQASGEGRDGAMAAVIGLDDAKLPDLAAAGSAAGIFTIANRNSPGQVVVSGERTAVEAAIAAAKPLGARKCVLLPVSVAAHSPLMAEAAEGMRRVLADVEFRDPAAPLLANADAHLLTSGEACREELVAHLTTGVDWVRAVGAMEQAGVRTFVEIGPGRVLAGLVKRITTANPTILPIDDEGAPGRLAAFDLAGALAGPPAGSPA